MKRRFCFALALVLLLAQPVAARADVVFGNDFF